MTAIAVLVLAVIILIVTLFVMDRNQCQRAVSMQICADNDFSCLLNELGTKRNLLRKKCYFEGQAYDRMLPKTNTILFDKEDKMYCVYNEEAGQYETVTVDAQPAEFLHKGACGACSNAQDFARYQETAQTLTKYTTKAAALTIFRERSGLKKMLSAGFTQ